MEAEALQTEVGEGLVGRALARVSPVGHQQPRDLEAEAADLLGLLLLPSHHLSQEENDEGKDSVTIFGGGLDVGS